MDTNTNPVELSEPRFVTTLWKIALLIRWMYSKCSGCFHLLWTPYIVLTSLHHRALSLAFIPSWFKHLMKLALHLPQK